MFQMDEKVLADSRTLITTQSRKDQIDPLTKNGTLNFTLDNNDLWLTTPKIRQSYVRREGHTDKYDKVVLARDGSNIDGALNFDGDITFNENLEVKKDLVVKGNFIVEGDSTIIDTPRLSVEDNIIEINRNEIGNGISLKKSGFAVNRGTKEFSRHLYDEVNKAFVFDTAAEMDSDISNDGWLAMLYAEKNGVYEPGEFRAKYRVTTPFAKITDSLTVSNNSTLNNLNVIGTSSFQGDVSTANTTVNGTFTVNNTSIFNDMVTVNAVSNFNDNVNIKNALAVTGVSTFKSKTTHQKGIDILEGANITGNAVLNNQLEVKQNAAFKADVAITGTTSTNNLNVAETTNTGSLEVVNDASIGNDLTVTNNLTVNKLSSFKDNVTMSKTLTVNGTSNFKSNMTLEGPSTFTMGTGSFVTNGMVFIKNAIRVDGDATLKSNANIFGDLTVNNDISTRQITASYNIQVEGQGNGISFDKTGNNNNRIYTCNSDNMILGGRLDDTSDLNMYFLINQGTNRGYVFKNGANNLFQIEGSGKIRARGDMYSKGFKVLTTSNTGTGNGLDSDMLDGLHAADFLRRNATTDTTEDINFLTEGKAIKFNGDSALYKAGPVTIKTDSGINNGFRVVNEIDTELFRVKDHAISGVTFKGNTIWHSGNDGADSGLDADKLDGKHADYFATADHLHDDRYIKNNEVDLKEKYRIVYNEEFDSLDFMYIG